MRDFQKARAYRAERRVERDQVSMLELDALAATLRADWDLWFELEYRHEMPRGVGALAVIVGGFRIVLGDGNHTRLDLLHEFAHLATERVNPGHKHGPLWAGAYLELAWRYAGTWQASRLQAAFEQERVRYITPGRLFEPLMLGGRDANSRG